ncbi:MAG: hypothetical protein K6C05_02965 [Anaerovibrio sp.]|uniref:hypothetical protein n=1 Tax=Anaerovibrio sp. TaxID=1872532 RepID=UPI0025F3F95D|nr:hypothetical protein [Anaerovibrio sp.]MCR5175792.1 hypothetical protein [Anaerovibrio sp.]
MNNDLDKTQPLPHLVDEMANQDTQILNHSKVRQLDPVNVNNGNRHQPGNMGNDYQQPAGVPPRPPKKGKGKTVFYFVVAFIFALLMGMFISGYVSDKNNKDADFKMQQAQSENNAKAADEQKQSLNQRKSVLDSRIRELEELQKKAQSEADTIKGKNEQLEKTQKDKSGVTKVIDQVTGKEAQEKKDAQTLAQQEKTATEKLAEINQSINEAKAAYDEVNRQLDELEKFRRKALETKENAEKVYNDNKGLIDGIIHYVGKGFDVIQGLLK